MSWPHWKIAAAFSAFTLATLLALVVKVAWFDRTIETEASEWRHLTLADGSLLRVGPRSRLRLAFGDAHRSIYLSRGEVVFQVAKDPTRPFLVNADLAVVRAVGTAFGVTRHDGKVVVTVAEGAVAVSQGESSTIQRRKPEDLKAAAMENEQSVAVSAGEQIAVARVWPVAVQQVDATRELAWAQGRLIFDSDTTLAEAVEEFNRRNRMQIALDDAALETHRVCCVFNADDPESFAESVATKPDIALVREGSGKLRLVTERQTGAFDQSASYRPDGAP